MRAVQTKTERASSNGNSFCSVYSVEDTNNTGFVWPGVTVHVWPLTPGQIASLLLALVIFISGQVMGDHG